MNASSSVAISTCWRKKLELKAGMSSWAPGTLVGHVSDERSCGMVVTIQHDAAVVLWAAQPWHERVVFTDIKATSRKLRTGWTVEKLPMHFYGSKVMHDRPPL